nr:GGDEF domain-containing phosphodiesterase [Marinomonas ostreistagni]
MSHGLVQRALTLIWLGLISTLLLSIVLFAIFYRVLSKPIQHIARWVESLDQQQGALVLPYSKQDELGLLTRNVADIWRKKDVANQQVRSLAYYDPLTELVNRRMFIERLEATLEQQSASQSIGAVMYLDVDRFKSINDSLGHGIGDQLLIIIAARLRQVLPDFVTLARFGGDEFVVLIPDLSHDLELATQAATALAAQLIEAVAEPIKIERNLIHCSTSMGITTFPQQPDSSSDVLRRADTALYRVKAEGRNGYQLYDDTMQQQTQERWQIEEALHEAIAKEQLELWWQPQVSTRNDITGAEVLLRWRHPQKGMIPPDEFISIAEESGQIHHIEEWVIEASLKQLEQWLAAGLPATFKHLAINISPAHFMQADFVQRILPIIERYNIAGVKLEFEITENLLIDNFHQASSTMATLQQHHISFAIDDFGTGYSSLRYLNQLPLNILKIDRSFIQRMEDSAAELAIVDVILLTAKKLGLEVIAEGVETAHQQQLLEARGCQLYQGFYFAKPQHHEDFYRLLTRQNGRLEPEQ